MALTVQAILQEHFEAFAETHPLADYQREAARVPESRASGDQFPRQGRRRGPIS